MAQFGSRVNVTSQNLSAVADAQGNLIISPDNSFGASPLGIAARTQAQYGIPNANFNILPDDPLSAIATGNELPYWQISNTGSITATMVYDDTDQTWAVRLDPSAAGSGDTLALTSRAYLLNDSDLSLRQKGYLSLTKVGTMATSQWDVVFGAAYYSHDGTQLSSFNIGTANSGSAWTSISGFTTFATAAIDAAAEYVDLSVTLTASTAVSGTAKVDLTSVLLQTASAATGGGASFKISEVFLSSGTWVVPTGVEFVDVTVQAGGPGGQAGGAVFKGQVLGASESISGVRAGQGQVAGGWIHAKDVPVATLGSVAITVGAGGAGAIAATAIKTTGSTTVGTISASPRDLSNSGGFSSFGTIIKAGGNAQSNTTTSRNQGYFEPIYAELFPSAFGTGEIVAVGGRGFQTGNTIMGQSIAAQLSSTAVSGGTYTVTNITGTATWTYTTAFGAMGSAGNEGFGAGYSLRASAAGGGGGDAWTAGVSGYAGGSGVVPGGGGAGVRVDAGSAATLTEREVRLVGMKGASAGTPNTGSGGGGGGRAVLGVRIGTATTAGTQGYTGSKFEAIGGNGGDGASGYVIVSYVAGS